jgi:hypothetical protein
MKKIIMIVTVLVAAGALFAQEEESAIWKKGGQGALNFSQTALSNWSGGGMNAISLNSYVSLFANYRKDAAAWENMLDLAYGIVRQGSEMQKTDDKIDLASKFTYKISQSWGFSGLLGFKTQMTPGYDADTLLISSFAAPAYLQVATGMEYKPGDDLSILIAPISGKMTFVADTSLSTKYGVDPGKTARAEFGGFVKFQYRKEIIENVVFQTKCELFSNYIENPHYIDVNWDVLLSMKINKFLAASLSLQLVYDHDYSSKVQFRETLGLGLSFSF